jgi:hypothetical protein
MGIDEKLKNAKPTNWPANGLSQREIKRIIFFYKIYSKFALKFLRIKAIIHNKLKLK